jgi:hypothetical protein
VQNRGPSGRTADGRRHCRIDGWRDAAVAPRGRLAWDPADLQGLGSPRQLLALGIDLAADEARNMMPELARHITQKAILLPARFWSP